MYSSSTDISLLHVIPTVPSWDSWTVVPCSGAVKRIFFEAQDAWWHVVSNLVAYAATKLDLWGSSGRMLGCSSSEMNTSENPSPARQDWVCIGDVLGGYPESPTYENARGKTLWAKGNIANKCGLIARVSLTNSENLCWNSIDAVAMVPWLQELPEKHWSKFLSVIPIYALLRIMKTLPSA